MSSCAMSYQNDSEVHTHEVTDGGGNFLPQGLLSNSSDEVNASQPLLYLANNGMAAASDGVHASSQAPLVPPTAKPWAPRLLEDQKSSNVKNESVQEAGGMWIDLMTDCPPSSLFEKELVSDVSTSTAGPESDEADEETFFENSSPHLSSEATAEVVVDFASYDPAEENSQGEMEEGRQLGGTAAGPISDAILEGFLHQATGEILWGLAQATLLTMKHSSPDYSSIIIFDWDDTLFPTTSLNLKGSLLFPSDSDRVELEPCAIAVSNLLRTAKKYGKVIIVTNAVCGWVQEMVQRFMPLLEEDLVDIPVISARSIYEPQGVTDTSQWKQFCFQRVVQSLDNGAIRSLVSIGDSWFERAAVFSQLVEQEQSDVQQRYVKSLKFLAMPGLDEVVCQVNTCNRTFDWLMNYESSADLWLDQSTSVQQVTEAVLSGSDRLATFGSLGSVMMGLSQGDS